MGRRTSFLDILIGAKDQTAAGTASASGRLQSLTGTITAVSTGYLAITAAASTAVGAIRNLTNDFVKQGAELKAWELRLGIGVEQLDALLFLGRQFNVQAPQMTMGIQRMTRRLGELATLGTGEAKPALDALGLSIRDFVGLSPDEQFLKVADALRGVSDGGEQAALAMKFFDSEGVALLQLVNGLDGSLRDAMEASKGFGAFTTEMAERAQKAAQQGAKLDRAIQGIKRSLVDELLGNVTDQDIKALTDLFNSIGPIAGGTTRIVIETVRQLGDPFNLRARARADVDRVWDYLFGADPTLVRKEAAGIGRIDVSPLANRQRAFGLPVSTPERLGGGLDLAGFLEAGSVKPFIEMLDGMKEVKPEHIKAITQQLRVVGVELPRDAQTELRKQILLTEQLEEAFGANVVAAAFRAADAWGSFAATAILEGRNVFDALTDAMKLFLRDVLSSILASAGRKAVAAIVSTIPGIGPILGPAIEQTGRASGAPQFAPAGLPRIPRSGLAPMSVDLNVSTVFGSRAEGQRVVEQIGIGLRELGFSVAR